jgi:hypothetical protein
VSAGAARAELAGGRGGHNRHRTTDGPIQGVIQFRARHHVGLTRDFHPHREVTTPPQRPLLGLHSSDNQTDTSSGLQLAWRLPRRLWRPVWGFIGDVGEPVESPNDGFELVGAVAQGFGVGWFCRMSLSEGEETHADFVE